MREQARHRGVRQGAVAGLVVIMTLAACLPRESERGSPGRAVRRAFVRPPGRSVPRRSTPTAAIDLVVRYPDRMRRVDPDSNFLFGAVEPVDAELEIDGVRVDVHAGGGFLAWLPVPEAERGDTAVYRLVVRTKTDKLVIEHAILRPPRAPPPGAESPWVDPRGLRVRPERWVRAGEKALLRFVAEGGATLALEAGRLSVPVGRAGVERGDLDRYEAFVDLSELREAACSAGRCQVAAPASGHGPFPALGVTADTVLLVLVTSLDGHERRDEIQVPIAVLGEGTWPAVRLREAPDPMSGQSGVVVGRPTPFGPYRWRFPEGTELALTGRLGDRLRVRLSDGLEAWVLAEDVRRAPPIRSPAVTMDARVHPAGVGGDERPHLVDVAGAVSLRVGLSRPVAAHVEVTGERSVSLIMYDTFGELDRIAHGVATGVASVRWSQEPGPRVRLDLELEWPIWGYRLAFEDGDAAAYEGPRSSVPIESAGDGARPWNGGVVLRLDLRPPPIIDLETPLVGRRIAIDPGHPGAGSTGPTGLFEGDANLAIAKKLADLLSAAGALPVLIRRDQAALGLYDRTRRARESGAELLVSIHNNALPDGIRPFDRAGTSTYYHHPYAAGLGRAVQAGMVARLGLRDLGVLWGDLAVAREPWMPVVVTEGAFMMIPEQEAALRTDEFREAYARGVMEGIESFLGDVGRR